MTKIFRSYFFIVVIEIWQWCAEKSDTWSYLETYEFQIRNEQKRAESLKNFFVEYSRRKRKFHLNYGKAEKEREADDKKFVCSLSWKFINCHIILYKLLSLHEGTHSSQTWPRHWISASRENENIANPLYVSWKFLFTVRVIKSFNVWHLVWFSQI